MRKKKISKHQFITDCVNKMFEFVDESIHFDDFDSLVEWAKENIQWYDNYKISEEGYSQVKDYFIKHYTDWGSATLTVRKEEFSWFWLCYGFALERDDRVIE